MKAYFHLALAFLCAVAAVILARAGDASSMAIAMIGAIVNSICTFHTEEGDIA
jgi:hypothetical protein